MDTEEIVKTTYSGVEIVYWESDNKWRFTLRGRERSAETLLNAKAAIDKPAPEEKAKPFEKVNAIKCNSYDTIYGQVTSIAEKNRYSSQTEVWFTSEKLGRRKEALSDLREDTPENRALLAEAAKIAKEAASLDKKASEIKARLTPLKIDGE
jgi:hypothetical protein